MTPTTIEIIGTGIGVVVGLATLFRAALSAADRRIEERQRLFWSNGGADLIADRIKVSVLEALAEHAQSCPLHDRVADLAGEIPMRRRG